MEFKVLCAILLKQDNKGVMAQKNNYKISSTWFYILIINRNKINEVDMGFQCKNFIIGLKFVETAFQIVLWLDTAWCDPEGRDPV